MLWPRSERFQGTLLFHRNKSIIRILSILRICLKCFFQSKAAKRARVERDAENVLIAMAKEEDKLINCDPLDVQIDGSPVELSIDFLPPFDPGMVSPDKRDYIVAQLR